MGTRIVLHSVTGLLISFILTSHLINVTQGSKVWGEVALPEDLEAEKEGARYPAETDDEDFAADEASGDLPSGEEDGSTPESGTVGKQGFASTIYYRALVNFTDSFVFGPELEDIYSDAFLEISDAVIDTLESEYNRITGVQTVSVVIIRKIGANVFVELDVASDYNPNDEQIRSVLYSVVAEGSIASYVTSVQGFDFRRLGEALPPPPAKPISFPVVPSARPCLQNEFACRDGGCIPQEYYCDKRPDCHDMSDELDCEAMNLPEVAPTPAKIIPLPDRERPRPPVGGPCKAGQATCQNGECIPRDYLCDGERDCTDGSDEIKCGTPSPCEPNEFKCQNGRCALKLWRCDGDNDCGDNSDESYCPTKGPGDTCAPEQFMCVMDRSCIPASYQCDEESDCADRSDEYDCSPPSVTSPPEESIKAQRGQTVTFTCAAVGVPTPLITWRLNWGHIPTSSRITVTNENGHGTLTIRDVKEGDQGAYTCEAINAKGMVFAVPDGVLSLTQNTGNCPSGHFSVDGTSRCIPCFCFGITKNCQNTGRYRNQIHLRFTNEDDFKGVNVSYPSRPGTPPLSSTQLLINPETEEFQLVDLSRRFLILDSYWTLPRQFLGNKVDSYGGSLKYKVRFILARGETDPEEKPDVVLVGNGQRLIYRRAKPTTPGVVNQREVKFTEEHWQHSSGRPVSREDLMMTLVNLESINIRTVYDNRMVSVALSDIVMDTSTVEYSLQGLAQNVEECRCPAGYSGLSCETCSAGFDRVSGGSFLGTCAGCNCNGHASDCDPISGHCLSCQHNTEGAQCDKCRSGYFGDPRRGRPDDCKPCPCPYPETSRRFSDTCFLDHDNQATCDACRPGYTGRRCDRCAQGYQGNPLQPNGKCVPSLTSKCDNRGTVSSSSRPCSCKPNVVGALCDECKIGSFHLTEDNPEGCLQCFCMGVTKQCASSSWSRDQVRGGVNGQLFALSNGANTRTITQGIIQKSGSEVAFRSFANIPSDIYYWVLPESFRGDKVTAYGGELRYTVRYEPSSRSLVIDGQPDVVLQGNGIFLEHFSKTKPLPRVPATITVLFREANWRRADGQPCTREHLLMALADTSVFMIRATYADNMAESSLSDIRMDIAVPHSTGKERALEVEECACPRGYRGPSCQDCDVGYSRTGSGLYLGTCERCDCHGHASSCDTETGDCLQCQHYTVGPRCDRCARGYYGDPKTGSPGACQPCPCPGTSPGNQYSQTCYLASDGQPTCDSCPSGYTGRRCERCAAGYTGNPQLGQACTFGSNELNGDCSSCDRRGTQRCDSGGTCRCKTHVDGPACDRCRPGHFHLSSEHDDGCLACFCMGVTQQCTSSNYYRDTVSAVFSRGNFQGIALVNRQRTNRITTGFTVEVSKDGTQLSFSNFGNLDQEAHYWQLPDAFKGDKREAYYARMRREHKKDSTWTEEQLRKDASIWKLMDSNGKEKSRSKRAVKSSAADIQKLDDEVWALISNFSKESSPPHPNPIPSSVSSALPLPSGYSSSSRLTGSYSAAPGYSSRHPRPQTRPQAQQAPNVVSLRGARPGSDGKYALVYKGFSLHPEDVLYWQLPPQFRGDKVGSYGGTLAYTVSYVAGQRGTPIEDADVQLIGNDITLVSRQTWHRGQGTRASREFEVAFKEENWRRPDGMPATREHLMMVLADLDDVLIRATYFTDMFSASISDIRMDVAVPNYSGLAQALEVEQCRCPPGYQGLSCQDCAPGYSRTGGGLYLGHCELCECNGHSDSCHPETGICTNCLHNTMGEFCDQCASGYFGDPTAGTPEDCQPCACPHMDPDYQFSRTCMSTGNGGYQCTACEPGYAGQYCERCAAGYEGDPQRRVRCRPFNNAASLVVKVHPERVLVAQGDPVTLRCQVTGYPPHYFYWSREDSRPVSSHAERRRHGEELYFPSIEPSDAGVYICTCRDVRSSNTSRAEIVVTTVAKPIEVTVEEPKAQSVTVGSTVSFICTAKSQSPAYTLVWTRQGNRKLPNRAMDFNGILTIQNVQPEDAGIYVCTGSNMFAMDEGTAVLYVPAGEGSQAVATVHPPVLTVQQGQRAEFRCTVTGSPAPAIEWIGGQGNRISPHAIIRGGVLTIPEVQRSDEGEYICKALNTHGEHTARAVLYVHSASLPHVQVSPQRVQIHEGETLRLYCRAGGTPSPGLTWKKKGGQLPPQAIPSHGFHQFKTNSLDVLQRRIEELQARMERTDIGTLLIPNIQATDSGTYLCVGTNSIGSSEAPIEVSVTRAGPASSVVTIQPPVATVEEGQLLDLSCVVPGNIPISVTWIRVGRRLSSNHQVLGTQLRILRASQDDAGEYICRVDGGPTVRQASVTVYVTPSSSREPISSGVTIQPPVATVEEGHVLDLNCVVPGSTPTSVTWIRVGGHLPSNHQVRGTQLRILRVSQNDAGEYICRVDGGPTVRQASVTVYVTPSSSREPISTGVAIQPPVATVEEGHVLDLNCVVPGSTPTSVTWIRVGGHLPPNHQVRGTQLRILRVSQDDAGEYICRADGGPSGRQASVTVYVTPSTSREPISSGVTIQPPVAVEEGHVLDLNCVIPGSTPISVTWIRVGGHLPSNHQVRGTQLRILRVSQDDAGEYICRVDGEPTVRQASVTVYVTPSSSREPISTGVAIQPPVATVEEGHVLDLNCVVPGSTPTSVTWIRVGGHLPPNHQVRGTQLRILRVSQDDAGEYICRADGGPSGRQASVTVYVTPSSSREPISSGVAVQPPVATVEEGHVLDLNCVVPGSTPTSVTWIRVGGHLPPNHQVRGTQLRILRASQDDAGEYICRVEDGPTVRQVSMTVYVTPSSSREPISSGVTIQPPVANVEEGQPLYLNCVVPGSAPKSVTWTRVGRRLPSNHQVRGTQLRILRVSQDDAGEYICRVDGGPTVRQASVTVYVSPSSSREPISSGVTIQPPVATVEEGQVLDLNCVVPGNTPTSVTWIRLGGHLPPNHQVRGTQLRILRVSQDDAGEYVCTVEDGPTVRQASVTVYVTPSSSSGSISSVGTIQPPVATVEEGQLLDIDCSVAGRHPVSVTWIRVDGQLPSNHQVRGTQLRILRASQDDAGEYICRVEDGPTVRQASVIVSVTPSSSREPISSGVTIEPAIASVQEGQPLDLNCVVPGSTPISVTWIRVGRHLSSNHQVSGTQLRILQASEDDSGDYICRVEDGPTVRQASVAVSVTASSSRLQTPIISIEPHTASVRLGETASFRCRVHTGAQPVRLEWKLSNNQPLPDNVKISPDGTVITIYNAQSSNQGAYRCVASNRFGITQSIVSLTVRESPKAVVTPQGLVPVRVGEPINLECQGSGEPRPSVSWHRLDSGRRTVLTSPVPMDSNAVMQVLAARPEDSGTYICTVRNSEGTTEVRVEVRVEGGEQVPSAPRASVAEPLMVVEEGKTVTLRCQAHGNPTPIITWSKLRSPLPWRHRVANNSLILPGVGRQDSGQYICNATNSQGTSEVTVMLDVETPPYATSLPDDLAVRVGEVIRLQCLSHGTPPLRFQWTKVNGTLPDRAEVDNGDLQINLATAADAGTYQCAVSNKVGSSQALAKVFVRSPLSVRVWPQVEVKAVGSAVEFTCSAAGGVQTAVEWLKEGGHMPVNHHIKDGVLRIENLELSDEGIYICRVTGVYGQAQDTAKLTIQALPKVMINVRTSVQTVMIGNSVEFECQAIGDPQPSVTWSKVGGELPAHVVVQGGMLKIKHVTEGDAGQYRCTATNNVGSVQSEVVLNIQSLPQIVALPDEKEVNLGSDAVMPCHATGYPAPEIKWSKLDSEMGPTAVQQGNALTIPRVKLEDGGTYVCTASNKQGMVQAFIMLKVHERVMPHFTQTPLSYLTLPTIKNSYKAFTIKINFRPDSADGVILYAGMIIYNGQKRTTGADFVSLGLVGGRPEFRFDVGSGMATIRYPTPIKLGEFHTVELHRNLTQGSIVVDGDTPVNGSSQGKFQGLDLNEELFIGGYPNYTVITKKTGLNTGFIGCIRQLIIQGEEVIFKDLDRSSFGVSNCPSCRDHPCQHGGLCQDSETSIYKCSCTRGYTGSHCEHHSSQHCHAEACGPDATCINRPDNLGYDCRCHLGRYGDKCMLGSLVTTPHFDGEDSFIAYPPLTNIHNDLRVEVEFKPLDQDGLMIFSGGKKMKVVDFVTLSMVEGHVEFRYELGTGMAILRSREPVTLGQWHRVIAERLDKDGSLKVDQAQEVRGSSPGKAQGLNIHTRMYLGGVPSMDILPKPANVSMLFEGCVGEVSINGKKVDLSYSFMESRAISQCVDNSPCDRRPCLNGGRCMSNAEYEYQCLCLDGFEGERCEVVKDACQVDADCQHGGRCASGQCVCAGGYGGLHCQDDAPVQYAAYLHDDGYLVLPKSVFPRSSADAPETIELEIRTTTSNGLILWQGVEDRATFRKLHASKKELGEEGKGKDFISLGLQSGYLVFSYQLGSGEVEIIIEEPINDGKWHKITAVRTGKQGYVQVDGGPVKRGQSHGRSVMVNTKGNVFLGGAPDMTAMTGGKFSSGMTGCVKNLVLMNARPGEQRGRPIDLQAHAQEGINVERCPS